MACQSADEKIAELDRRYHGDVIARVILDPEDPQARVRAGPRDEGTRIAWNCGPIA